ncbi:chloride channel protein [Methyloferula stellata]|uniref:chloride channel protein n=1 Tax=Methyloferula stellata TaxID=876270 RepID=UPI00037BB270
MAIIDSRYIQHLFGLSRIAYKTWRRRFLFLIGGICVGLAAIVMAFLADITQSYFRHMLSLWPYVPFFVTPLGFGFCAYLARNFFPGSQGSGIPQVIAATQVADRTARLRLVSLRVAFGKVLVMMLGFLSGASIGREGPSVQVGAAIMGSFAWLSPYRQNGLLLAGSAAGIAAAFNTPLAGIVFGIEEMSRSFESKTNGLVLGAVIAAGLTSLAIVGDYAYFGSTPAVLPLGPAWAVVPVCGIAGGLSGGLFSRILILFGNGLPGTVGGWIWRHPIVFAILCGLGVAICGFFSGGTVHGTGYEQARAIVHGENTQAFSFASWKFLATIFSSISGIPGGLFAPSLSIGAGLGVDLSPLFHNVPIGALALLGMVAYLSGVVQAPMTSFVIVGEMTEDHAMIIPLMVAAVIATACSKLIYNEGLYHALAKNFVRALGGKPEELAEVEE